MRRVAVIIVTWNRRQHVLHLLASLAGVDPAGCRMDVTVVDNASEDGTVAAVRERFPAVRLLEMAENIGGAGGFNAGLRHVAAAGGYDYCWLLDNDVEVDSGALAALVEALESDAAIGAAGSQVRQLDDRGVINETGGLVVPERHGLRLLNHRVRVEDFDRSGAGAGLIPVDYCAASSLLVRVAVLTTVGFWKDLFIHFDDVEWCLRMRRAGYRVVCSPRSVVWHLSADGKPITWMLYYDVRNYLHLLRDHYGPRAVARAMRRFAGNSFKEAIRGRWHLSGLYLRGVRDFLADRMGRAEGPLLDGRLVVPWDRFIETHCHPHTRLLTTAHFRGRPEAELLERVERRVGSVAVWEPAEDPAGPRFLPAADRVSMPRSRFGRAAQAVVGTFVRRRPYDVGLLPHDKASLTLDRRCRRTFLVVDGGVIPIDTSVRAAVGRCGTLVREWWEVWRLSACRRPA